MPKILYEALKSTYDSHPIRVCCSPNIELVVEKKLPIEQVRLFFPINKDARGLEFHDMLYAARERGCFDDSFVKLEEKEGGIIVFNDEVFSGNSIRLHRMYNHKIDCQSITMDFSHPLDDEVRLQYINFLEKINKTFMSKNIKVPIEKIPSSLDEHFREYRAA